VKDEGFGGAPKERIGEGLDIFDVKGVTSSFKRKQGGNG